MNASDELAWRGFVNQTTYKDITVLNGDPVTFYWGVDPSADSMTIGNLAAAMMAKCFIKHGHKPVLLIGGATGLIGDPDGKSEERTLITQEQVEHNKSAIAVQYAKIFEGYEFSIVDNYDWFKDFNYLSFLRDVGKNVPMRQMLNRDFVESRLQEGGAGISYAEFSYVLIQAYDFLHLHEEYGVTLQVCGSDQWGNSIAGVDLIRRKTGHETHVYSTPLVINKATGKKFGKSEAGAIWLDANKTSPTEFYQFWINADDLGVEDYLMVFTELDKQTIDDLLAQHAQNRQARLAQTRLAEEVTRLIHGQEAVELAQAVTQFLTGARDIGEAEGAVIEEIRRNIPSAKSQAEGSIATALVETALASSLTDARRLIQGNAVSVNGQKAVRDNFAGDDFRNGKLLIRRGKAFKDSAFIEL